MSKEQQDNDKRTNYTGIGGVPYGNIHKSNKRQWKEILIKVIKDNPLLFISLGAFLILTIINWEQIL